MAYCYSPNLYSTVGEFDSTYEYDVVPFQGPTNYYSSSYDCRASLPVDYFPNSCYVAYEPQFNPYVYQSFSPYGFNFVEPQLNFLQYEPPKANTYSMVSHPTIEADDIEFDEYDPTPYGGGYDITKTYGKPLPPSDETCYPRSSMPASNDVASSEAKPPKQGDAAVSEEVPAKQSGGVAKEAPPPKQSGGGVAGGEPPPKQSGGVPNEAPAPNQSGGCVAGGETPPKQSDGVPKEADQENLEKPLVSEKEKEGRINGEYGSYDPYGYGLEGLDLCESLFGYWPCLAKMRNRNMNCCWDDEGSNNVKPYQGAVDYIFGSPFQDTNGEQRYHCICQQQQCSHIRVMGTHGSISSRCSEDLLE